ncbi:MAG: thioesterase family protein [Proteobacteria bacterium]|nr:thioesterase family protein [Pseudomonadota bacterium]HQR03007.1 thioesterase family protein [Rhodocyclaceae bacterium]
MDILTPFRQYETEVPADWIDINEHMNSTCYTLAIYDAHRMFTAYLGLGDAYVNERNLGKMVVESHLVYEREVLRGDRIAVDSRLLGVDRKRFHFYHELLNLSGGFRAAVLEQIDVHVDLSTRRSAPVPEDMRRHLARIVHAHRTLGPPEKTGRHIAMLETESAE